MNKITAAEYESRLSQCLFDLMEVDKSRKSIKNAMKWMTTFDFAIGRLTQRIEVIQDRLLYLEGHKSEFPEKFSTVDRVLNEQIVKVIKLRDKYKAFKPSQTHDSPLLPPKKSEKEERKNEAPVVSLLRKLLQSITLQKGNCSSSLFKQLEEEHPDPARMISYKIWLLEGDKLRKEDTTLIPRDCARRTFLQNEGFTVSKDTIFKAVQQTLAWVIEEQ